MKQNEFEKSKTTKMKMKILSRLYKILAIATVMAIVVGTINLQNVYAAGSFSVSGGGTVSAGGSGTVSISASDCAGEFTVSASGGGIVSSSRVFLDNGSTTITVNAPSSGKTTVTVIATDVTGYDEAPVTGSRSVTFTVKSSSSGSSSSGNASGGSNSSGSSSSNKEESANNNLKSIKTSCGVLSPVFSVERTKYNLYINKEDKECVVSAVAEDARADVSVSGKSEITDETKGRTVTVTAENGKEKKYEITYVYLTNKNIIVDEKVFVAITDYDKTKMPKGLTRTKIKYKDNTYEAYKSDDEKYILLTLQDDEKNVTLYLYNEAKKTFSVANTIEIDGDVYLIDDKDYKLLYGDSGEGSGYYLYNEEGKTLLYMDAEEEDNSKFSLGMLEYILIGSVGLILLVVLVLQIVILRKNRIRKLEAKQVAEKITEELIDEKIEEKTEEKFNEKYNEEKSEKLEKEKLTGEEMTMQQELEEKSKMQDEIDKRVEELLRKGSDM